MAPPSSSSSSPSSASSQPSNSPSLPPFRSHHFTPIQECDENEENEERQRTTMSTPARSASSASETVIHHPTPVHPSPKSTKRAGKRSENDMIENDDARSVSCNNCRPSNREKTTTVVPMASSPNGIMKSIVSTLSRKSPRLLGSSSSEAADMIARDEQWKAAVAELSQKLMQATRKKDEANLEAMRVKSSMAELEKTLNRLELYCKNLKSGLEICSATATGQNQRTSSLENEKTSVPKFFHYPLFKSEEHDKIIENFLVSVSEVRKSVRVLSRALTLQLRQMGAKVTDRMTILLQPYDVKISISKNPRGVLFYLEALLNLAFFEDFESVAFAKNSMNRILNPIDRCEAKYGSFNVLHDLTWEEVLTKGTRHFDEEFSGFCDRKMSEIVALLGWNKAWPEQLLHAFFGASKSVWLVHLLANSVHPTLPIFRVEKGAAFASVYMEDMGAEKARKLVPSTIRIMVAPGFYVYDNVVKCKVLCRYHSHYNSSSNGNLDLDSNGDIVVGSYSTDDS